MSHSVLCARFSFKPLVALMIICYLTFGLVSRALRQGRRATPQLLAKRVLLYDIISALPSLVGVVLRFGRKCDQSYFPNGF